jgi:hypothetical protein
MISYGQLKKKLNRACLDSGLSDDEKIHALIRTLVGIILSSSGVADGWHQRSRQMAKSVVRTIIDEVSFDAEEARTLAAELVRGMAPINLNEETHEDAAYSSPRRAHERRSSNDQSPTKETRSNDREVVRRL